MPKTSTSFKENNKGKPKGAKSNKTIVKEQIGLSTWESMAQWLVNEGLDRYKEQLQNLKGKDYVYAHTTLMEYFKPKLNRTTLEGGDKPIEMTQNIKLPNGAEIKLD